MTVSQSTSLRGYNTFFLDVFCCLWFVVLVCLHSCSHGVLQPGVGLALLCLSSPLPSEAKLLWIHQVSVTNPTWPHIYTVISIFCCLCCCPHAATKSQFVTVPQRMQVSFSFPLENLRLAARKDEVTFTWDHLHPNSGPPPTCKLRPRLHAS